MPACEAEMMAMMQAQAALNTAAGALLMAGNAKDAADAMAATAATNYETALDALTAAENTFTAAVDAYNACLSGGQQAPDQATHRRARRPGVRRAT